MWVKVYEYEFALFREPVPLVLPQVISTVHTSMKFGMKILLGQLFNFRNSIMITPVWKCSKTYYWRAIWQFGIDLTKENSKTVKLWRPSWKKWLPSLFYKWPGFLNWSVISKDDLYQVSCLYHQLNNSPKILLLTRTRPLKRPLLSN